MEKPGRRHDEPYWLSNYQQKIRNVVQHYKIFPRDDWGVGEKMISNHVLHQGKTTVTKEDQNNA